MKKICSIILIAAVITAFGMTAVGCSSNTTSAETQAPTAAATQAATAASTEAATQAATAAATAAPTEASTEKTSGGYAGLSQDDAMNKAMQANPGYYVNSIDQGKDPSGKEAWVVDMINDDLNAITVYVTKDGVSDGSGSGEAQPTSSGSTSSGSESDTYAGHTRNTAVNDALASMNFECYVDSVSQGTDNFGRDAWIIILNGSDGNRYISYVSKDGTITNPYTG